MVKSNSDEKKALVSHTRRGRRGSPYKRGLLGIRASHEREASQS